MTYDKLEELATRLRAAERAVLDAESAKDAIEIEYDAACGELRRGIGQMYPALRFRHTPERATLEWVGNDVYDQTGKHVGHVVKRGDTDHHIAYKNASPLGQYRTRAHAVAAVEVACRS